MGGGRQHEWRMDVPTVRDAARRSLPRPTRRRNPLHLSRFQHAGGKLLLATPHEAGEVGRKLSRRRRGAKEYKEYEAALYFATSGELLATPEFRLQDKSVNHEFTHA